MEKIIVAGIYIHYAESLLTEKELSDIKSHFRKTLLIMPGHTTVSVDTKYNIDSFIDDIEVTKAKHNFDTVLVCIYWTDYQKGRAQKFIDKGYKLCSAGHIYDRYFLNRLRSIISLADVVMSNLIGTNLGYSIALNKPYYLKLSEKVEWGYTDEWGANSLKNTSIIDVDAEYNKKAAEYFGEYREDITEEQRAFVEKYWGK